MAEISFDGENKFIFHDEKESTFVRLLIKAGIHSPEQAYYILIAIVLFCLVANGMIVYSFLYTPKVQTTPEMRAVLHNMNPPLNP
jgi:hypothetical protein